MRVIDQESFTWTLFEDDVNFFLDINCNHGAFGYAFMIELSEAELECFKKGGREYLTKLAHEVHYSAPVVSGTQSVYKDRNVTHAYDELCRQAIKIWQQRP